MLFDGGAAPQSISNITRRPCVAIITAHAAAAASGSKQQLQPCCDVGFIAKLAIVSLAVLQLFQVFIINFFSSSTFIRSRVFSNTTEKGFEFL